LLLSWPAFFKPPGKGGAAEHSNSPMSRKKRVVQDSSQATLEGFYVNLCTGVHKTFTRFGRAFLSKHQDGLV